MASLPNAGSLSSPLKFPASSGFESVPPKLEILRAKMNRSMSGLFVGPMPVSQFLEEFLKPAPPNAVVPPVSLDHFNALPKAVHEKELYQPFISLVHDHGLVPDQTRSTMYREDVDTSEKVTQFEELELHLEFKPDDTSDPLNEPDAGIDRLTHQFEASTVDRSKCRAQLIHYATEWCSRQHRRFAFTIFIGDPYVRFIRWDRAGAIVSEKFNFRQNSRPLAEFLWRFTHLDDAGRGRDPSVRIATAEEAALAEKHLSDWKPRKKRPVIVFKVPDVDGKPREFIAWGCLANPGSLTGRCTRAYPVYEIATKKRFFLKDTWRAYDLGQEADILRELQAANVEHIPPFVCGGDLLEDVTMTDLFVPEDDDDGDAAGGKAGSNISGDEAADQASGSVAKPKEAVTPRPKRSGSWRCGSFWKRITQRFHHRFVVDFIDKHFDQFSSSKQMMQAVSDAFAAHRQAYERCKIIHRDISSGNILIAPDGRGILNDWDLAKRESELKRRRRHEKTGTWEFMSCLLLQNHHPLHTIQDDMESFVHVILYHAIRYLPHNKSLMTQYILDNVFSNQNILANGDYYGGEGKRAVFMRDSIADLVFTANAPLTDWVEFARDAVRDWIAHVDPRHKDKRGRVLGKAKNSSAAPVTAPSDLDLTDHESMASAFADCLLFADWPPDDTPIDALAGLQQRSSTTRSVRSLTSSSKHPLEMDDMDEDGSIGGARKRTKNSQARRGSRLVPSSSHSMNTRSRTRRSET
ncbi:hypothetical protein LshimejAT787_1103310 [Lyophyllum shimeji]|uniref:Protein kinase domain-containing protein n=1 Tax=Lyophyllum shimeji TaxID=47721 RepID=A0A9P3PW61_LYOSH|nr:hypothetical protein LshimejAT787_1103310 [Lyophyllum shimeji]